MSDVINCGCPLPAGTVGHSGECGAWIGADDVDDLGWDVAACELKGKARIVALDAVSGKVSDLMSRLATENLTYLSEAVRQWANLLRQPLLAAQAARKRPDGSVAHVRRVRRGAGCTSTALKQLKHCRLATDHR